MKRFLLCVPILFMAGCASIAGEKTQPLTIQTIIENREVVGAGCTLANDAGTWFITSPGSVVVHKSTGDLAVDCSFQDIVGHETLVSKSNGAVWGNILAGGGIGYIVDRNTGAGFDYPSTVVVAMRRPGASPQAASAAAASVLASSAAASN